MMQPKLITDYTKLSEPAMVAKTLLMVQSLAGNLKFPLPWDTGVPTLAAFTTLQGDYSAAVTAAVGGDSGKIATRKLFRAQIQQMITNLAPYLEKTANKDIETLESTGYDLRHDATHAAHPSAQTVLPGPANLTLKNGTLSTTLLMSCKAGAGASAYEAQLGTDPNTEASYTIKQLSSRCRNILMQGTVPGTLYYGRIRAIGPNGPGAWSDIAQLRAL